MKRNIPSILFGLVMAFGLAFAQDTEQVEAIQAGPIDRPFIQAAAQGDMYEISSSELAQERGTNEDVQAFAQRMIQDHTMTSQRIMELGEMLDVEVPTAPGPTHQARLIHLRQLEGADFDLAYMQQQMVQHQDAVMLFAAASMHAENEEVRAAAEEFLPALREHLEMAQDLVQQLQ